MVNIKDAFSTIFFFKIPLTHLCLVTYLPTNYIYQTHCQFIFSLHWCYPGQFKLIMFNQQYYCRNTSFQRHRRIRTYFSYNLATFTSHDIENTWGKHFIIDNTSITIMQFNHSYLSHGTWSISNRIGNTKCVWLSSIMAWLHEQCNMRMRMIH